MTASHAIFPSESVCRATTWLCRFLQIQIGLETELGRSVKIIESHVRAACWCVLPAFPISNGYLRAKNLNKCSGSLQLSEFVAAPCVFLGKRHHHQSPQDFLVPSLRNNSTQLEGLRLSTSGLILAHMLKDSKHSWLSCVMAAMIWWLREKKRNTETELFGQANRFSHLGICTRFSKVAPPVDWQAPCASPRTISVCKQALCLKPPSSESVLDLEFDALWLSGPNYASCHQFGHLKRAVFSQDVSCRAKGCDESLSVHTISRSLGSLWIACALHGWFSKCGNWTNAQKLRKLTCLPLPTQITSFHLSKDLTSWLWSIAVVDKAGKGLLKHVATCWNLFISFQTSRSIPRRSLRNYTGRNENNWLWALQAVHVCV